MSHFLITDRCARIAAILSALSLAAFTAPDDVKKTSVEMGKTAASTAIGVTKYCILEQPTGTRMSRKVCKTKEQWAREGYPDIDQDPEVRGAK